MKDLGAAGQGAMEWWMDRLMSVALIPLTIALVVIIASLAGSSYAEAVSIVSHPLVAIVLILCVVTMAAHMRNGLQTIIEDYVHHRGWKYAALAANNFYAAVVAVACLYAIMRISMLPFVQG